MKIRQLLSFAILGLAALPQALLAVQCKPNLTASNPDSIYVINNDGTVTDSRTSLMWKRCAEGQVWNGAMCSGSVVTKTWAEALATGASSTYAGHADWRLPNIKELTSLIEWCTDTPAVNTVPFPGFAVANRGAYWSSSPTRNYSGTANLSWSLEVTTGAYDQINRINNLNVLLVRNFQALAQTIGPVSFTPATLAVGGTSSTLNATSSSGLPVSFSSATTATCSVAGDVTSGYTVSGLAVGTCTVTAAQSGNGSYAAATPVQGSVTVGKGSQTISAISVTSAGNSVTKMPVGGTVALTATATSGLAVSFGAGPVGVCTIVGGTVTAVAPGICNITADQGGNANYFAATPQVTTSVTVLKAQTISFAAFTVPLTAGQDVPLTANSDATPAGSYPVSFSTTTQDACSVTGNTTAGFLVKGLSVGTSNCAVVASQAGDAVYAAAVPVTRQVSVNPGTQTIGAITLSVPLTLGGTATVAATASSSLTVTFSVGPADVCTLTGAQISGLKLGTCAVVADQPGNASFQAAPTVVQNFTVGKGSQAVGPITLTLSGGVVSTSLGIGATGTLSAPSTVSYPATPSTTAVVYGAGPGGVCTVSGTTLTAVAAGTCNVTADRAGDANYQAAPQATAAIMVLKGQTITFTPPALNAGQAAALTATTADTAVPGTPLSAAAYPITFTSSTLTACTVSGNSTSGFTVTGVAAGTSSCTLVASQAGDAVYAPATKAQTISVGVGAQTISGLAAKVGGVPVTQLGAGGTAALSAVASPSALPVTFTSQTAGTCTVSGNTTTGFTVTAVAAGLCTLAANQAGNANYSAAPQVTTALTVLANQTINFTVPTTALTVGQSVSLTATSTATPAASYPVSFITTTPTQCTISGNTVAGFLVSGVAVGTSNCIVVAQQAGDATYAAAAPVVRKLSVGQGAQTIGTITATPATLQVGGTAALSATASSGLPVSFGVAPASDGVCTISGNTLTGRAAGTCAITADQPGSVNYTAAPQQTASVPVIVVVVFNPPSLTFAAQAVGTTSAAQTVTLTNNGATTLTGISVTATVPEFGVSHNCDTSLAASAFCTLSVTLTPTSVGTRLGAISVASSAAGSPHSVVVSGSGSSNPPICTLTATPTRVARAGSSATLTASCTPAAASYTWTGGTCAGTSAATCIVTPTATTAYTVTGTNGGGTSTAASATVTFGVPNLTPILMLLLD